MRERIVFTKKELKEAVKDRIEIITIEGNLAKKIHKTKLFGRYGNKTSKWEGKDSISFSGVSTIAALTGIEIAIIIVAVSVGLGIIIALWKNYEEVGVELETDPPTVRFRVKR